MAHTLIAHSLARERIKRLVYNGIIHQKARSHLFSLLMILTHLDKKSHGYIGWFTIFPHLQKILITLKIALPHFPMVLCKALTAGHTWAMMALCRQQATHIAIFSRSMHSIRYCH